MVGQRELPNEVGIKILIDYIKGSLWRFTPSEFKLAFTLLADGKLDIDREHYQSFSTMFLGKVMEAYSHFRFNYLQSETSDIGFNPTKEEIYKYMKGRCLIAFQEYKEKKRIIDFGNSKYRFLVDQGILKFSNERWEKMILQAKKELDKETSESGNLRYVLKRFDDFDTDIVAKEIALKIFFDDLIEMGIELSERFE